jgi:hypothetical protein
MRTPALILAVSTLFVSVSSLHAAPPAPATAGAAAPATAAQAEVSEVKFSFARFGSDSWLEADIEIEAKPGGKMVSGEYINRVRVVLNLLTEATDQKGAKKNVFYRSAAELVALEGGKSNVRFYLPPEIVKRDKLERTVDFFAVELEVGGEAQTPVKTSVSTKFTTAESVKNFIAKTNSDGTANEGLLMPQYLTPFASDSQRRSPTYLRREAQR